MGRPRNAGSCARAGVATGPPPAAATAMADKNAIARAAGALCCVLIGLPSKDMPMCAIKLGVKLVTRLGAVNATCHHDWVMKAPPASNPLNTATAGQGFGSERAKTHA